MRMWMVNPQFMCDKHLFGEHCEIHMFIGSIKKGIKMDGYLKNNLLEPMSLVLRHSILVKEIKERGYKHESEINDFDVKKFFTEDQLIVRINQLNAYNELMCRCSFCLKKRYEYGRI